jgi:hypothetical protein
MVQTWEDDERHISTSPFENTDRNVMESESTHRLAGLASYYKQVAADASIVECGPDDDPKDTNDDFEAIDEDISEDNIDEIIDDIDDDIEANDADEAAVHAVEKKAPDGQNACSTTPSTDQQKNPV